MKDIDYYAELPLTVTDELRTQMFDMALNAEYHSINDYNSELFFSLPVKQEEYPEDFKKIFKDVLKIPGIKVYFVKNKGSVKMHRDESRNAIISVSLNKTKVPTIFAPDDIDVCTDHSEGKVYLQHVAVRHYVPESEEERYFIQINFNETDCDNYEYLRDVFAIKNSVNEDFFIELPIFVCEEVVEDLLEISNKAEYFKIPSYAPNFAIECYFLEKEEYPETLKKTFNKILNMTECRVMLVKSQGYLDKHTDGHRGAAITFSLTKNEVPTYFHNGNEILYMDHSNGDVYLQNSLQTHSVPVYSEERLFCQINFLDPYYFDYFNTRAQLKLMFDI